MTEPIQAQALQAYERAAAHYQSGRLAEARAEALDAIQREPKYGSALHMLAMVAHRSNDHTGAFEYSCRALSSDPDSIRYRKSRVQILIASGRYDEALSIVDEGFARAPDSLELLDLRSEVQLAAGRPAEALRTLSEARRLAPDRFEVLQRIGESFSSLGRRDPALEAFAAAAAASPEDARPHFGRGIVLRNEGAYDLAGESFRRAYELDPRQVEAVIQCARIDKARPDDFTFAELEKHLQRDDLSALSRATVHLALGKIYEDIGQYDRAFDHFARGNEQRALADDHPPAIDQMAVAVQAFEQTCDEEFFATRQSGGPDAELPVFIVGMPRSGTTLIETILACHPQVYGAGELIHVPEIAGGLLGKQPPQRWAELLDGLTPPVVRQAGESYGAHLQSLAPEALRIVDKLPENFRHLWLISLIFPGARIIHARRDPLDTCLSCYVTDFIYSHNYRNDLDSLGRFYRWYQRLMAHWMRVCPLGFLEVDYEALIADQETTSRRLIEFLDLPWDPACLEFHKSRRSVQTASNVQVGHQLYRSSIGRWRRYEKHLGPLIDALAADPA